MAQAQAAVLPPWVVCALLRDREQAL